jgi:osmoprotectant transport system permease protein
MSGGAVLIALAIALPVGVGLGHAGRGGSAAINVGNIGRALPSFGILVLFAQVFGLRGWPGFGARPALVALVLLGIPPILTNAYVGMRGVDPDVKDAARGMGMTGRQLLSRVELPLALPLAMAGVRTSTVQVVATATLAAVTAWGGLGRYIVDGFAQRDNVQIFAGAVLVGLLALLTELSLALLQRGLSRGSRPRGFERHKNRAFVGAAPGS